MEDTDVEDTPKPKRKVNYAIQPESEDEDSQIGIEGGKYVTPKAFQKKASNFQPASKSDSPEITDFVIDRPEPGAIRAGDEARRRRLESTVDDFRSGRKRHIDAVTAILQELTSEPLLSEQENFRLYISLLFSCTQVNNSVWISTVVRPGWFLRNVRARAIRSSIQN
jgi:hypothetical protein